MSPSIPRGRRLWMRLLWLTLQALLVYIAGAVIWGMFNDPRVDSLRAVVPVVFLVFAFLITILVQRMARLSRATTIAATAGQRRVAAAILTVLAALFIMVAHGVAIGMWRGPSRLKALHFLATEYAGSWSLVAVFGVISGLLLTQACLTLTKQEA